MKKQQKILIIAVLAAMGSVQGINFDFSNLITPEAMERMGKGLREMTDGIGHDIQTLDQQIAGLERNIDVCRDPVQKKILERDRDQLLKAKENLSKVGDAALDAGVGVMKAAGGYVQDQMKAAEVQAGRDHELKVAVGEAHVKAEQDKQARIASVKAYLDFFANRKNVTLIATGIGMAAVGVYGAKEGSKVLFNYIDSLLGKPQLVRESSVDSYWRTVKDTVLKKQKPVAKLAEVIVSPNLEAKLQKIALATKTARTHNEPFMNALFYGPPGVGKTMYAKELAKFADMEYATMSGADFSQFKEGEDIAQLHSLFDWAEHSKKGLIVFIDEADSFLRKRTDATQKSINLTNAFLSRVEKQTSDKVMFVFATNHPDVLDSAILSRIAPANRIQFVLPGADERARIFDLYLKKYVLDKGLTLEAGFESNKQNLVAMMDTLTGRDIEGVVTQMARDARLFGKEALVYEMAEDLVKVTVLEKKKEAAAYKA